MPINLPMNVEYKKSKMFFKVIKELLLGGKGVKDRQKKN
jgi:hypothetical protein